MKKYIFRYPRTSVKQVRGVREKAAADVEALRRQFEDQLRSNAALQQRLAATEARAASQGERADRAEGAEAASRRRAEDLYAAQVALNGVFFPFFFF